MVTAVALVTDAAWVQFLAQELLHASGMAYIYIYGKYIYICSQQYVFLDFSIFLFQIAKVMG